MLLCVSAAPSSSEAITGFKLKGLVDNTKSDTNKLPWRDDNEVKLEM